MSMVSSISQLLITSMSMKAIMVPFTLSHLYFSGIFFPWMPTFSSSAADEDIILLQTVILPLALYLALCWAKCPPSKLPLAFSFCLTPLICIDSQYGCCELCTCCYHTSTAKFLQRTVSKGDSGRNLKITVEHTMQCWLLSRCI